MALKVGELYGTLRLDDKDFGKGVDSAKGKFGSLVGGVAKGGLVIAGALTGAAAAGGALSFKLANVAGDLNESMSKVQVVFADLGDEMVAWSKSSASALGMSQQAALEAAGTYGNLFQAMGIAQDESAKMSQGLVELSADLASFNNMDPTEVLDSLRSGLSGETEPLKRLGVNINQARLEAKALEMGLWDGTEAIDASAKAQATYALILEDTKLAQGDFARTSDGMANQQRILGATFEDAMASIGAAAIPIFEAILPMLTEALTGVAAWASENGPAIQEVLAGAFAFIGEAITFLAENAIPLLASAFTFFTEEVVPIIAAAIGFIVEEVLPRLVEAFSAVAAWVAENGPTIGSVVGQVFGAIANVIQTVWPIIEAVASVLFPALGAAASALFEWLDRTFKEIGTAFEVLGDVAQTVFDAITDAWDGLSGFFDGVFSAVASAFKGGFNVVIGIVNGLIGFLNNIRIPIPRVAIPGTDIGVGGGFFDPFNIGRIPYLARGVRNFGGGLAIVGEAGPELVSLPRGADVFSNAELEAMGGYTYAPTIHVNAPTRPMTAEDIGLEARRFATFGLRRRPGMRGAPA